MREPTATVWGRGLAVLATAALAAAGCSGDPGVKDALRTFPAKGTITLDGKAFGPAQIKLHSDDTYKPTPGGAADASGNFVLKTYKDGDGAPAGSYKAFLLKDPMSETPSHPAVYDSPDTTPFLVTIEEKPNELVFDMKSDAGPAAGGSVIPPEAKVPSGVDPAKAYGPVRGPEAKN